MYNTIRAVFVGIILLSIFLVAYLQIPPVPAGILFSSLLVLWITYLVTGSFRMRARIFVSSVCSLPSADKKNIILTFDDGPHPEGTPRILDILAQYNAKAIFFCIGKNITAHPELAQRIVSEGHILANHSYNHSNFIGIYSTRRMICEIEQTEAEIGRFMPSLKLYRPPFGVTNPNIARAVKALNMTVIGWNQRSFDTVSRTEKAVLDRIAKNPENGDIVLFHDTQPITSSILAAYLLLTTNKGFTFEVNAFKHK